MNSRDMCISPALLDYLEQTLEPFDLIKDSFETVSNITTPVYSPFSNKAPTEKAKDPIFRNKNDIKQGEQTKELQKNSDAAAYFPVEVVVFVSMLPSSIRFTCQPQSTMECMLKLPTLELAFSTYKIDSQTQDKLYNKLSQDIGSAEKGILF